MTKRCLQRSPGRWSVSFAIGSDSTDKTKELVMPQRKQAVAGGNFREDCLED